MHFANQIWKFNVVEIMGTSQTSPEVIEEATKVCSGNKDGSCYP